MPRPIPTAASTNIAAVEYDDDTRELSTTFHSGDTYVWMGVPASVADGFAQAPSAGQYFNRWIKDRYPFSLG